MRKTVIAVLGVLLSLPVLAGTRSGVTMPDTIEIDGQKLVLNGMAVRKKIIFKVYIAGLYLPQKESSAQKILQEDKIRSAAMHFVRSVEAEKIREAWLDGLKSNTPGHSAELKGQFDLLCKWMEDMSDGQRLTFTYVPEKGTEIKVKNSVKGTIPGKAFADALFACWIGPKPGPGGTFKNDILGVED